ncbi:MAG: diguanylate cyclase domain-containing protein, partial [Bryobacteraceae bacterium]
SMTARPVDTPAGPVGVSISVGVVSVANWPSDDLNQILQIADAAMYRAKAGGRNHVVMADAIDFETAHRAAVEYSSHGPARD